MDANSLKLKVTVFNLIFIVSFHIQCAGVQSRNNGLVPLFKYLWAALYYKKEKRWLEVEQRRGIVM